MSLRRLVLLLLLVACGDRHPHAPETQSLAMARARAAELAAERPGDAAARRELGLLAWFDGDRDTAQRELEAAIAARRGRPDPVARLVLGWLEDERLGPRAPALWSDTIRDAAAAAPEDRWSRACGVEAVEQLARRAAEDGDRTRFAQVAALAGLDPGAQPVARPSTVPPALAVAALGASWFVERGDVDTVALGKQRGTVTGWRMVGQTVVAPEWFLVRPDSAAPASPPEDAAVLRAPLGFVHARPPVPRPGIMVLEAVAEVPQPGELEVELEVDDATVPARLWLGDTLVLGRDPLRHFAVSRQLARVKVEGSVLPIRLALAHGGLPVRVRVILRDPATGLAPKGLHYRLQPATGRAAPVTRLPAPELTWPVADTLGEALVVDVLMAHAALGRGDADAARAALERVREAAPRWLLGHDLAGQVATAAPGLPGTMGEDLTRRELVAALEQDPLAHRLRLQLVQLLYDKGDTDAAIKALGDDAAGARPLADYRAFALRSQLYEEKGRTALADAAVDRALELMPGACVVQLAAARRALRRERRDELRSLAGKIKTCRADTSLVAALAAEAGELGVAAEERQRLAARAPYDTDAWLALARARVALDEPAAARAALIEALGLSPGLVDARLMLADLVAASGDLAGARAVLVDGLELEPEARDLAHPLVALGGEDPLKKWRVDGLALVKSFKKNPASFAGHPPAVVLLDRMVVRVLPSGARLAITHSIAKVLEKDGLEEWGELAVPEGAELLTARTIKADGQIREPQEISGKSTLSAPDLAVGDFVELEYLTVAPALPAWQGGFIGERFFFSSYDAPLLRSELVLIAPTSLAVSFDARGDAPPPELAREGDLLISTFAVTQRPQLVPEPDGVPTREWMASVQPYLGASLGGWQRWVSGQLLAMRRADLSVTRLAQTLAAGKAPAAAARAIHAWVEDHIDDGGSLADEPAAILARGQGRRTTLILALCAAAGIETRLWLVRSRDDGRGEPDPTTVAELSTPVVELVLPGGSLFIDARQRWTPLGLLPVELRDAPAMLVPELATVKAWSEPTLVNTPKGDATGDRRELELAVTLAADGSARVKAVETATGLPAAYWRDALEDAPADEVEKDVEQRVLGFYFPGASLEKLVIDNQDDADKPLVVHYDFVVPHYAQPAAGGLALPLAPMPSIMARRYLRVGARTTTQIISAAGTTVVHQVVALPAGMQASGLPGPVKLFYPGDEQGGLGSFVLETRSKSASGSVETTVTLSGPGDLRVVPSKYPDFVGYAQAVDAAEAEKILVR